MLRQSNRPAGFLKTKRASLACTACHDRKIKCDLQDRAGRNCANCQASGSQCRPRYSKRAQRKHALAVAKADQHSTSSNSNGIQQNNSTTNPDNLVDISASSPSPLRNGQSRAGSHTHTWCRPTPSYIGEAGFMSLLRVHWKVEDQDHVLRPTSLDDISAFDFPPDVLQDSFLETYNEYCFAWCPVIEPADLDSTSPLLKNALALAASQIKPNAIHRASPEEYYNKAKKYFYEGQEANPITAIKAILLFYWWSPISPLICSQDSIWWWTGMAIRMAQEIGLHREPDASIPPHERGLRRRIWWTLFARERLTALSQGRPCLINLADCDVKEPVLEDFPDPQDVRAETFIQWVRLCRIIGAMSEHVTRPNAAMPFPSYLFDQLGDWIAELPGHLMLKIATSRTIQFNREVSLLFLPYLTAVTLLQFTRTGETATPKAGTTAMLAATCVARTFQDLLLRGGIRYLPAISGWYITVALLALLSARRVENLASMANEHIQILQIALNELSTVYAGTDIAVSVFERLIGASSVPAEMDDLDGPSSDSACLRLFPFVTPQTNDLVSALLDSSQAQISQQLLSGPDFMLQFDELLDMVQNIPPLPEQIPTTSSADRALPDCTA